jgi:tRNA-specific 2-thiouridylase
MPFYVFNFTERFESTVMRRFAEGYLRGETPNPCIDCNRYVKITALLERALLLGYDGIATGHYARRSFEGGRWLLRKGLDAGKDQSYVLYCMTQAQLARTRFPLGELHKAQVREQAAALGFLNAEKPDSQDICFVPDGDYGAFLERHTGRPLRPGDFIDPEGRVLGRHRGTARYTLGQRKGLGLALPARGYVCALSPAQNTVTVGGEALLYSRVLEARELNWIACERLDAPLRCRAKVRYRQAEQRATVEQTDADTLRLTFDEPQRAITPGQAVVLYDGDTVLGGGTVSCVF